MNMLDAMRMNPIGCSIYTRTLAIALLAVIACAGGCTQQQRPETAIRNSAEQRFRAGDFAGARDDYAEIVAKYPGNWQDQYRMGLCMIETQQYSRARQAMQTAYTLKPTQEVADGLAKVMFLQKDESQLFAFLRQRATETQTTAAYLQLGYYAMELNDPDSAKVAFDTAIEIDHGKTTAPYLEAAKLEERLGHLDIAIDRLRQAYGINPYDPPCRETDGR
jgi:tetratricopeptide (TPR) repeat protein